MMKLNGIVLRVKIRSWYLLWLILFTSNALIAAEVAGIKIDDEVILHGNEQTLTLNGAGVRKKFFASVYIAALYLAETSSDAEQIIVQESPKRISMHIIYSEISKEKITGAWNDGFVSNQNESAMLALEGRLEEFNSLFDDLYKGDRIFLDYLPELGTKVTINSGYKGMIQGVDFYQALLKVWLGERPVTKSLKAALLSK